MEKSDLMVFQKTQDTEVPNNQIPWKILIVDDEDDIHEITKRVISDLYIFGCNVSFFKC